MRVAIKKSVIIVSVLASLFVSSALAYSSSAISADNKNDTSVTLPRNNSQEQSDNTSGSFREEVK